MLFREIFGHTETKRRLRESVLSQRVPHAQLFCGPEGTGKLPLALAYAQYLSCENRTEEDSCGVCQSCRQYAELAHPDLQLIFPIARKDSKDKSLSVDYLEQWRRQVAESPYFSLDQWCQGVFDPSKQPTIYNDEGTEMIRRLQSKAGESEYKTVIVWHPELMGVECSNRVLKNLEEPQGKTLFIFVSDRPDDIIQTILSRLQRIYIPSLSVEETLSALTSLYPQAADDVLTNAARISCGNLIAARAMVEEDENSQFYLDAFIRCMRAAYARDLKAMQTWSEEMAKLPKKRQLSFLQYSQRMVRENFIYNLGETKISFMTDQEQAFSSRFARFINEGNIWDMMALLSRAELYISRNTMAKITFYELALRMIMILKCPKQR